MVCIKGRLELLLEAVEGLVHQHLGHAAEHPLTDAGDGSTDLTVGVDADGGTVPRRCEADPGHTTNETGATAAFDVEGVAVRLVLVGDLDLAVVGAADRGHPDLHGR